MVAGKILLVEDNPDDVALTRRALKKADLSYELSVVGDGQEALDYLFAQGKHANCDAHALPDLILLDLKLPLLDGLQVLEKIKADERTRLIPVVILTSSKQEEDVIKSYNLGANSYVRKRVDAIAFQETLGDILIYWFSFAKLPSRN